MRAKKNDLIEINLYLGLEMHTQLQILQDAGLGMSAVARLAIRKCVGMALDADDSGNTPARVLLYLHPGEAEQLEQATANAGERSKSSMLRRYIATYLRINSSAIDAMF